MRFAIKIGCRESIGHQHNFYLFSGVGNRAVSGSDRLGKSKILYKSRKPGNFDDLGVCCQIACHQRHQTSKCNRLAMESRKVQNSSQQAMVVSTSSTPLDHTTRKSG